jgi:hypothetical protein
MLALFINLPDHAFRKRKGEKNPEIALQDKVMFIACLYT